MELRDSGTWYVLVVMQVMMFMVSLVGGLCFIPGSFSKGWFVERPPRIIVQPRELVALALAN
jgi:hypothetical protein